MTAFSTFEQEHDCVIYICMIKTLIEGGEGAGVESISKKMKETANKGILPSSWRGWLTNGSPLSEEQLPRTADSDEPSQILYCDLNVKQTNRSHKINPNSKAYNEGIQVGDYVEGINGQKALSGKSNGTMNGDIHNHIDHELEILNSGDTHQGKTYKPVSFGQRDGHSAHYSPMTGTSHMVRSRTAPASPVLQPRLKAGSVSSVTSADETPPSGNPCYWSTTPPSSCSSTPPMRPRLPKHFKPTPFLPQASHDVTPTSKQSTSYTEASKPPFSPRSERRVLRPREMSPSTCSEEGGSDRSWSSSGAKDAKIAPMKKSKGLKLFRRMQKKLQSLGIPVKDEAPHQPSWQQTREAPPPPAARSVSGEERRGMPIPIRVETGHRAPSFGSPQSRSYSMDSPQSQPHYVVPPPRDFASGRSELPREIPVVFEGISQGLRNLRQAPVDQGQSQCVDYTGHSSPERGYRQEVPINRTGSQQSFVSPPVGQRLGQGQREIPIQIKTSVSDSGSKPDSPRQIRIEHERKKADLERKRVVLERDINNVINEAIKQVPVYNKPAQEKVEPSSASQEQNQDEIMEQKQMADRKQAMQTFWKAMEKQESDSEKPHQQTFGSGSYATLPVKKKSIEEQKPKPTYYETEAGSYSTLPSFRHKSKESPVLSHRQLVQQDRDYSFSDVEGGRGKAQPSWRPSGSPLQSRHVWKPIIPPKEIPDRSVTPEPKHLPVKEWRPLTGPEPPRRQESRSRPAQQEFTTGGQSQSQPQQSRGYIPIQIQYEQKPVRKVGEPAIEEGDSSLSSFDTADTSSEVRMNGTHAPTPPAKSPKPAVWSPGMQHSPSGSTHSERTPGVGTDSPTSSLKEVPQKWTPGGSALFAPKGYKPIKPDFTKTIDSRKISSTDKFIPKPEESYAWKPPNRSESESLPTSAFSYQQSPVSQTDYSSQPSDSQHTQPLHYNQSSANGNIYNASPTSQSSQPVSDTTSHVTSPSPRQRTISSSSGGRGEHHVSTSMVHLRDEPSRLPPSQSPYITLLQKNRENGYPRDIEFVGDPVLVTEEGKIPKGAIYLGKSESVEGDVRHTDSYYAVPTEDTPPVQAHSEMKVSSPKRYEDIGPIDQESGMPLSFRQNVEEEKQHDWYKQMYKSLHKGKRKEAENNYKPTYQFPEDEDKSDSKSVTVTSDKSRTASLSQYEDTGSAFVQRVEDARHFFELASPRSQPLSSKSSNISMSSPLSPKSPALSPKPAESSSTISTLSAEKTSPLSASSKSPSAISDSSSSRLATKNEKEDKPKSTLTSLSEKLRRDAKFSSGKQIKREEDRTQDIDIEVRAVPAKAVEHEADLDAGYRSEPEYRSKLRSKSTSGIGSVGKTARTFGWSPPSARASLDVYRNQPRSIVDYEPGFSSIAFRESKTAGSHNPPPELPGQYSTYTEGRRRQISEPSTSEEVDPIRAYKQIQRGGEIPYKGLNKPAPEKSTFHHLTTEEIRSQQPRWSGDRDQRRREEEESPSQKSPIPNDRFEEPIGRYGAVPEDRRRGFQIQGKARGLYNFTAQNNRELPFRKGDTIYLIRQIDANWFEGEKGGRVGIFPVNYVEILTSIEEAQNAAQQSEGLARAKYSFTSQTSVELSLRKGETVTLLRKVDDNWFEGRHGAQQGIFPVAYVEVVREPSTPLVTPAPSVICTPMTGRGTPEMLSPMSYDGAPTPPPMPSPGAFKSSTLDRYNGSRYGSQQVSSPRQETQYGRDQFDSSPANRQYSQSPAGRQMNGGYSTMPNSSRRENVVARSSQSPQIIRRDNPPTVNITAKSVSSPNIHVNSHDHNRNIKQPEEDLALARYRAVYAYKPQNEDELELLENDEVY
ncbi:SRBS1-like protein [Mya arenaria]|uniref:SRBS1-like protein n=1 Tax=Mya arenaria TaxID=6604 RepID=A0ABY7DJL1_MYAAR|nr:SRBS1-like protein [Mya arenaria]